MCIRDNVIVSVAFLPHWPHAPQPENRGGSHSLENTPSEHPSVWFTQQLAGNSFRFQKPNM
jgi:hypothetical protein